MGKSLAETVRKVISESNDSSPDRDAKKSTQNSETLKPKSKGSEDFGMKNDAEDLDGATPTKLYGFNLGSKASKGKDTSRSSLSQTGPEPMHTLSEEDLENIIAELVEGGLTEEEIDTVLEDVLSEEDLDEANSKSALLAKAMHHRSRHETGDDDHLTDLQAQRKSDLHGKAWDTAVKLAKKKYNADIDDWNGEYKDYKNPRSRWYGQEEDLDEEVELEFEAPIIDTEAIVEGIFADGAVISEDVNALIGDDDFSEDFRHKAQTIFESAVKTKVHQVSEDVARSLESIYEEVYSNAIAELTEQMQTDVGNYIDYVVEQWIEDNEVAIESGLRVELMEDFVEGLRKLFSEHYIEVPDDKVNIVEELSKKVGDLEHRLDEEIDNNVRLKGFINESRKYDIIEEACDGLTLTQAEKLKSLAENVAFSSESDFVNKVTTLREGYFPEELAESTPLDPVESSQDGMLVEGRMGDYVKTLGKTLKK